MLHRNCGSCQKSSDKITRSHSTNIYIFLSLTNRDLFLDDTLDIDNSCRQQTDADLINNKKSVLLIFTLQLYAVSTGYALPVLLMSCYIVCPLEGFQWEHWVCTLSCCLTRSRSQEEAFSRITLRMGCQSSETSEPSVTEARTLTCRPLPPWLFGTPRIYRDCFPTSLRGFRYKLEKQDINMATY